MHPPRGGSVPATMRGLWSFVTAAAMTVAMVVAGSPDEADAAPPELREPPVLTAEQADNHITRLIYLERCKGGCTLTDAPAPQTDARYNISYILNNADGEMVGGPRTVPEWRHGDAAWDELVQCVKDLYAPYDVVVTDVDPGENTFHHKAIVAGAVEDIGYANAGGVAPSICRLNNNAISFTFANDYPNQPIRICEIVGQETAHSFGLEHAYDCSDPMTYLPRCGRQFFRDATTRCGEFAEEDECVCGGSAQNSHRWLLTVLGENPVPVPGPDVEILSPAGNAMVNDGFLVSVTASHMRGIGRVELWINGTQYQTIDGWPWDQASRRYDFNAPSLPDGIMDVQIKAYNDIGSESTKTVTVTKGAPCQTADTCVAGQQCQDGRCFFPAATGELGDECTNDMQCISGLCPDNGGERRCSQFCFPTNLENTCPSDDLECLPIDSTNGICWPTSGGGGGCAASTGGSAPTFVIMLVGMLLVTRRRRCRRM